MAPGDDDGPGIAPGARVSRRTALAWMGAAVAGAALVGGTACRDGRAEDDGGDERDGDDEGNGGPPGTEITFGTRGRAALAVPDGATSAPVVITFHGGFWRPGTDRHELDPLVATLLARGWASWNVDLVALGEGAGWPVTFTDVAEAVDHVAVLADDHPVDASKVVVVGHGSGGALALWAAGRTPAASSGPDDPDDPDAPAAPGGDPVVRPDAVVGLAAVTNLAAASVLDLGVGAVDELMGVSTSTDGEGRYLAASPIERLPIGVPVLLVHGTADPRVPVEQATTFADRARDAGDAVDVELLDGVNHLDLLDPEGAGWTHALDWIATRLD